jgi:hypothetical protein
MNLTGQFSRLPDGTNHVDSLMIDGVSKQLKIAIQNSNYHTCEPSLKAQR